MLKMYGHIYRPRTARNLRDGGTPETPGPPSVETRNRGRDSPVKDINPGTGTKFDSV